MNVSDPTTTLTVPCSACSAAAGVLQLRGPANDAVLVRDSFTSELTQPVRGNALETLRDLLRHSDVAGLYAFDSELTPFWCPQCKRAYCGDHWQTMNVFDDETGGLDCIRGSCPRGHERMLED